MLTMCEWYYIGGHTKINLKASIALSHRRDNNWYNCYILLWFLFSIVVNSIAWFVISTVVNKYYWNYTGFKDEMYLISKYAVHRKKNTSKKHDILIKPSIKVTDNREQVSINRKQCYFS